VKLNIEVAPSSRNREWVWRVRSDDSRTGDSCLALGLALTQEEATRKAEQVRQALTPIFTESYRSRAAT
jgi:hypothetical protein